MMRKLLFMAAQVAVLLFFSIDVAGGQPALVAVSKNGCVFRLDENGTLLERQILPYKYERPVDKISDVVFFPDCSALAIQLEEKARILICQYADDGLPTKEIALPKRDDLLFSMLRAGPGNLIVLVAPGENDYAWSVRGYGLPTAHEFNVTPEVFATIEIDRDGAGRGVTCVKEMQNDSIKTRATWEDFSLRFSGQIPSEVHDWFDKPTIAGPGDLPLLRLFSKSGAVFSLSCHPVAAGERHSCGDLFWHSDDKTWSFRSFPDRVSPEFMRGPYAVFSEQLVTRDGRNWVLSEPHVRTGRWFIYHFPTKRLSCISLSPYARILDIEGDRILATEQTVRTMPNGGIQTSPRDTLYMGHLVDGAFPDAKSFGPEHPFWRPILKNSKVAEMKWVFLLPEKRRD